jgi:predicted CXXCH cytochrome family protein
MRKALAVLGLVIVGAALATMVSRREGDVRASRPSGSGDSASTSQPPAPAASAKPARRGREELVGSATCASCHRAQGDAYLGSHHAKALVTPSPELAKARFEGSQFASKHGGMTKFALREAGPVVITPAAGGKTATFGITHVSGVWPIEQYVVATERGKLQALGVVWDSRAASEGGNRWFHVYGADGIAPDDPLFFTSPAQNWNHMCAECHSTWVERRYDPEADSFDTRWAEPSVGCEACHGPGAEHVRSAVEARGSAHGQNKAATPSAPVVPLPARLKPSALWTPSATGSPAPHAQDGVEVEVCAPCHSRRAPLKEAFLASDPFLDSFAPELLLPGRYHADGQVEGEVYEWASFLQSRMYQAGVKCSDCHDPHSAKPYAQGNQLCVRCHEPARFDVEAHSHHSQQSVGKAPLCIDCHMPPSTFMQIDERRDHSIRVPRPDHSALFGTPDACNGCHTKRSPAWARDQLATWFPASPARPHFVDALGADRKGALDAPRALRKVVEDLTVPAIARATALERLGHYPAPKTVQTLRAALGSPEPLVVYGAVLGTAQLPLEQRAPLLLSALEHSARAVRVAAAKLLAGVPVSQLPARARPALDRAFVEVLQSFSVSASRAETHVERSAFELARGSLEQAEASLRTALRLQPCLPEAQLNLADLARQRGDEGGAGRAIRAALACSPQSSAAHHALGLWQVRARQPKDAIASLRKAVELAPSDTRFSYVLAVALNGNGERAEAIRVLEVTLKQRPNEANTLQALASYLRDAGQNERAAEVLHLLDTLLRD